MDIQAINDTWGGQKIDCVIDLAGKAGVRPSIECPEDYFNVNIGGTVALLEFCRRRDVKQFVFASSSSVYGLCSNTPWNESEPNLKPISPYAASKLACEKIGCSYSYLFGIRFIALRFFTVFGPRQRPDLAIHKFMNCIRNNRPIEIYGDGTTSRDYTYIDDIVSGIMAAMNYDKTSYEIFNLGNSLQISLNHLLETIERKMAIESIKVFSGEQAGDVPHAFADIKKSHELLGYNPAVDLEKGIENQVRWFLTQQYD